MTQDLYRKIMRNKPGKRVIRNSIILESIQVNAVKIGGEWHDITAVIVGPGDSLTVEY